MESLNDLLNTFKCDSTVFPHCKDGPQLFCWQLLKYNGEISSFKYGRLLVPCAVCSVCSQSSCQSFLNGCQNVLQLHDYKQYIGDYICIVTLYGIISQTSWHRGHRPTHRTAFTSHYTSFYKEQTDKKKFDNKFFRPRKSLSTVQYFMKIHEICLGCR